MLDLFERHLSAESKLDGAREDPLRGSTPTAVTKASSNVVCGPPDEADAKVSEARAWTREVGRDVSANEDVRSGKGRIGRWEEVEFVL